MKGQIDEMRSRQGRAQGRLRPVRARRRRPRPSATCARSSRDPEHGWIGPFVMATYNTRIVRRSHCAARLRPGLPLPRGLALRQPGCTARRLHRRPRRARRRPRLPAHAQAARQRAPEPGRGPEREGARDAASSGSRSTARGHVATVAAKGDPGYAATAVMMGESALCLALDGDGCPSAPASSRPPPRSACRSSSACAPPA